MQLAPHLSSCSHTGASSLSSNTRPGSDDLISESKLATSTTRSGPGTAESAWATEASCGLLDLQQLVRAAPLPAFTNKCGDAVLCVQSSLGLRAVCIVRVCERQGGECLLQKLVSLKDRLHARAMLHVYSITPTSDRMDIAWIERVTRFALKDRVSTECASRPKHRICELVSFGELYWVARRTGNQRSHPALGSAACYLHDDEATSGLMKLRR